MYQGVDSHKGEAFYRPIGGGIEFGELAAEALDREIQEEIGARITDIRFIGVLENIFTYQGVPGHELVMMFDARFVDHQHYQQESLAVIEGDNIVPAVWKPLDYFRHSQEKLYPDGLYDLLKHWLGS